MTPFSHVLPARWQAALLFAVVAHPALAQAPAPAAGQPAPAGQTLLVPDRTDALAALGWLQGCWRGSVNQREFREHWMPAAGGMMIGVGHTVISGRTQDYQYLRLEERPDAVYYVATPSGEKEATFRLSGTTRDEASGADIYTFDNVADAFPQHIVYRRGAEGWLYAGIEGTLNGTPRKVLYPMRHVSCESGEFIVK